MPYLKKVFLVSLLFIFLLTFTVSCTKNDSKINVIESTQYYKIIQEESNSNYKYQIFDKDKNEVKTETLSRCPKISVIDNSIIKVTVQAGTGLSTQWGYFYDIQNDKFSEIYYCIYDQSNGKVVFGDYKKVVVTDMFDKNNYYLEISNFKEKLPDNVVEPIISAEFLENGNKLKVTHYVGTDYNETEEIFDLK